MLRLQNCIFVRNGKNKKSAGKENEWKKDCKGKRMLHFASVWPASVWPMVSCGQKDGQWSLSLSLSLLLLHPNCFSSGLVAWAEECPPGNS